MADSVPNFRLCRLALSSHEFIELAEDDYFSIVRARETLSEITSLEEKFYSICEIYRDIEEFIFKCTFSDLIYGHGDVAELHSIGAGFGRRVSSMLSAAKLYNDTTVSHIRSISNDTISLTQIKVVSTAQYDTSFEYRVMEAIRNHAQHRAFPVHSAQYSSSWSDDRSKMIFSSDFYFDISKIENDKKFKKNIRSELQENSDPLSLKKLVRSYFSSLCKMHMDYRSLTREYRDDSINTLAHWRSVWEGRAVNPSYLGLAACKFNGDVIDKEAKRAFVDPQLDEYRDVLEKRTRRLVNMDKREVIF